MKRLLFIMLLVAAQANAQDEESIPVATDTVVETTTVETNFGLGSGLSFSFNDGAYKFKLSGMLQPSYRFTAAEHETTDHYFNAKRAYLSLSGTAVNEKISFLLQNDFSRSKALLDAWIAYGPYTFLTVTLGQKQTFTNNREMTFFEDKLQFTERGLFSTVFSNNTGREFGLFVETKFGNSNFSIMPKIAITSGDGINSFGSDSRDVDKGGLKYGGRLDILPLGDFKPGNDGYIADVLHEESVKILAGGAFSYNNGASHRTGEGHGEFMLYDYKREQQYPDYTKIYADVLLKYSGFSLLAEYVNASASALEGSYTNSAATVLLYPGQISEYLILGDAYNLQLGYVTRSGYSLDLRYENLIPEFNSHAGSLLTDTSAYTVGFTKYFRGNNLKLQVAVTSIDRNVGSNQVIGELVFQVVF
ncbi:MAG: hypothetical protein ACO1N9_08345 [Flavobacterium sp.]